MLWNKIASLFDGPNTPETPEVDIRDAIAVLLIHASKIDGIEDESELTVRDKLLSEKFGLTAVELTTLTEKAAGLDEKSVDLYRFTSVLTKAFDQEGRKHIVRMLWEIVLADDVVTDYESNFMWRVAELLGITTRDRVTLRKAVETRFPDLETGAE